MRVHTPLVQAEARESTGNGLREHGNALIVASQRVPVRQDFLVQRT
jgi:hypothetical protein